MSIQRHTAQSIAMRWHGSDLWGDGVDYVLYTDHVAEMAEVERAFASMHQQRVNAYNEGAEDERARILAAVQAISHLLEGATVEEVLAIIDGRQE